jgi:serine/threonine-protein kinase
VLAGKYRVERILGQGGMGVVVEARHIALDERVALKFLLPDFALHPEFNARFLREARNAVRIKSEHVARVSDVGTLETGAPYMVMEYLEGRDLSGVLEKTGVLSIPDAVDYIIQGCEAIAEAHGHGIVHRDLKPANLFLSKRPDGMPIVKVLDFGISKNSGNGVDNLTKTTASMGSALYMSPEQMQETRSVDHRTDIYALGISLYELLAGKQPFWADTLPQLCAAILTGIPRPLREARPDVPEPLAHVVERAYARERGNRYQSIAEFVIALAPFAPPRSQNTIERVARIGGLPLPQVGSSGVFPAAAAPVAAPVTGAAPAPPAPVTGQDPPPAPSPPPPSTNQIVPGPYSAPMSVRAAASFAQGATGSVNPSGGGGKVIAAVVIAMLLAGVVTAVAVLELAPKQQVPQPPPSAVPTAGAHAETAAPVDTAKTVEAPKPAETVKPAETAAQSAVPTSAPTAAPTVRATAGGRRTVGGPQPQTPIAAPPPTPPKREGGVNLGNPL